MKSRPKRYQLKKETTQILLKGHPWLFRSHLSSAAQAFTSGQWLALYDSDNQIRGHGIYDAEGLIGVRILSRGKMPPTARWIHEVLERALVRRQQLRNYTNAYRAIFGENDGLPGVVLDVYGDTGVLQTYSSAVDLLGRYLALQATHKIGLKNILWRLPAKRRKQNITECMRWLRGDFCGVIPFHEGRLNLFVDVTKGQKSGTFLDLRGLRKWTIQQDLTGKKVLNLFSYTGALGLASELAGAREIVNVDISQGALDFAKQYHALNSKKQVWIKADVFKWVRKLSAKESYDLIVVDPPLMAMSVSQVWLALKTYENLYQHLISHLKPHGILVACCCTSRIARKTFRELINRILTPGFRFLTSLAPEDDHPVGFAEGDYLKILIWRRT